MTELTSAVRAAQAEADRRFGDGPVPTWEPPPVLSDATRRWLAVVAAVSVLATALLVAIAVAQTTPAAQLAPTGPSTPTRAVSPAAEDEAEGGKEAPSAAPAAPAPAPRLALERRGADWHLSAQGATRQEVVQRLAQASGATLHGWPDATGTGRPVQLQWQGRSLAQLWPIVLGPELNFALQCRRERCDVWILGAVRPDPASTTPSLPAAPFAPPALPLPMPGADEDNAPVRD